MHIYVYICFIYRNATEDLKQKSAKMSYFRDLCYNAIKFEMCYLSNEIPPH